jgi:hypothetical protein
MPTILLVDDNKKLITISKHSTSDVWPLYSQCCRFIGFWHITYTMIFCL